MTPPIKTCPECKNLIPVKGNQFTDHLDRRAEEPTVCAGSGRYTTDLDFMTVGELIRVLQKCDPNMLVEIPLQTYTQVYPSLYAQAPFRIERAHNNRIRIWVHLGEGFIISERKRK